MAERIMSMKNSNDNIGNRTRDLPVCSAVPQPIAAPRSPEIYIKTSYSSAVDRHIQCLVSLLAVKERLLHFENISQLSKSGNFCDRDYCLLRCKNLKKVAEISFHILMLVYVTGTGVRTSNIGRKKDAV